MRRENVHWPSFWRGGQPQWVPANKYGSSGILVANVVFSKVFVFNNVRDEQTHRALSSIVRFGRFLGSVGGFSFLGGEACGDFFGSSRWSSDVPRMRRQVLDCRSFAWADVEAFGHDAVRDGLASTHSAIAVQDVRCEDNDRSLGRQTFAFHADVRGLCDRGPAGLWQRQKCSRLAWIGLG